MTVSAWVGGHLCGQSEILEVYGQIVYAVDVVDEREREGCGASGRQVTFRVGHRDMRTAVPWDSAWLEQLALEPERQRFEVYLPLVLRR